MVGFREGRFLCPLTPDYRGIYPLRRVYVEDKRVQVRPPQAVPQSPEPVLGRAQWTSEAALHSPAEPTA